MMLELLFLAIAFCLPSKIDRDLPAPVLIGKGREGLVRAGLAPRYAVDRQGTARARASVPGHLKRDIAIWHLLNWSAGNAGKQASFGALQLMRAVDWGAFRINHEPENAVLTQYLLGKVMSARFGARNFYRQRWQNPTALNEMANIDRDLARFGAILRPMDKLAMRGRKAKLKIVGLEGGGVGKEPVLPPDPVKNPEEELPPKTTIIPGIVSGRNVDIVEDDGGDPEIFFKLEDKHLTRKYHSDGTISSTFKIPYMDGDKKAYQEYQLDMTPVDLPAGGTVAVKPLEVDEVVGHETKTRPKVIDYINKVVKAKAPDGKTDVDQVERTPVYEMMKDEKGNDVPVQETYINYLKGEIPAHVELETEDTLITVQEHKGKSKETMVFEKPIKSFDWTINTKGIYFEQMTDRKAPGFSGFELYDVDTDERLPGTIAAPNGKDSEGFEIACHYELEDHQGLVLRLVVDDDLTTPATRKLFQWVDKTKDGEPVLDEAGQAVKQLAEVEEEVHDWAGPFVFDPTISWDSTRIQISGTGCSLPSIKTLYSEGFNNVADATNIDTYDALWAKTVAGASTVKTSTAQYKYGNSSVKLHKDGANACSCLYGSLSMYDYTRLQVWVYAANVDGKFTLALQTTGTVLCEAYLDTDGHVKVNYGNGAGGNNTIDCGAYVAATWYEVLIDVDMTNDKYRFWFNGVLWSGTNANAGGWDRFKSDAVGTSINQMNYSVDTAGTSGNFWFDSPSVSLGDETYQYGNLPYNCDELTEAVSPTGTLSGMDGAWTAPAIAVDATSYIIGSQSIKGTLGQYQDQYYTLTKAVDITNCEGVEFYYYSDATSIDFWLCTTSWTNRYRFPLSDAGSKWWRYKIPFSSFIVGGALRIGQI